MDHCRWLRCVAIITNCTLSGVYRVFTCVGWSTDGAGFDFEGLSVGSWSLEFEHEVGDGLISLVRQTRAALRVSNPSAEVAFAVSTNNNKWFNSSYRMAEITAEIDYTILMGYDMWHRNTDAGPNAPLPALKAALRSFLHGWGTPASKLVLGIPW